MSNLGRWPALVVVGVFLLSGAWLLANNIGPGAESVGRQQALQALAPVASTGVISNLPLSAAAVTPVVVDLQTIPAGVYDPNNQLDRWLTGEIDLDENEGIVSAAEKLALQKEALSLEPSGRLQLANSAPGLAAPAADVAFDSLDYTECCGGGGNVPPDPELAVGPNHAIAVVNVAFEIYDKNGNSLVAPTTFSSFMGSNPSCSGVFDPNVLYDEAADRYILGIDADGDYYCAAVSQTGDPTGQWNVYAFFASSDFFDYPHAGVGQDAIYMGGNIFKCRGNFNCRFDGARVWAFDKWAMYNGQAIAAVTMALPVSEDTPQPLHLHGWNQGTWPTGGPHYFFTTTDYNGADYSVWSWDDPFGANSFGLVGTVDLVASTGVAAGLPLDAPQLGGGSIQANDLRPQDFEYRDGFAWSVQTISCNPGGGTVNCVRWNQVDPVTATVIDAGVYASNGEYRIFGDLAVNACSDMAVGYTKSSSSMYPGIWYTGRQSGDPAGTLQSEAQLKAGEIAYTSFESSPPRRWGDYTEMTIDPDGVTFWYLGEYSKNTGNSDGRWGTYIGSFSYACDPGGGPTPTPSPTVPGPTNTPPPPTPTATTTVPGPTNTPPPPTPTATPSAAGTMHVADLDGASVFTGPRWTATVTVLVVDNNGSPVANAAVDGFWTRGNTFRSDSCTTGGNGSCFISLSNIHQKSESVNFTVSAINADGLTYDDDANSDPDGDSDGTTITVNAP